MSQWLTRVAKQIHSSLQKAGPQSESPARDSLPPDIDPAHIEVWRRIEPFTLTTPERIFALCNAVEYITRHKVPGDIVECGVWKGGSMMAIAHVLKNLQAHRRLYAFDTFTGMPQPTERDKDLTGTSAAEQMVIEHQKIAPAWAYKPSFEEVQTNLRSTGYREELMVLVKGMVEDTVPMLAPERIALLRLDTDWYESTYHELVHLYPRLSVGGVLIIDDYGHWRGAREATDRYMAENQIRLLLNRIDYTGRIAVKLHP